MVWEPAVNVLVVYVAFAVVDVWVTRVTVATVVPSTSTSTVPVGAGV